MYARPRILPWGAEGGRDEDVTDLVWKEVWSPIEAEMLGVMYVDHRYTPARAHSMGL